MVGIVGKVGLFSGMLMVGEERKRWGRGTDKSNDAGDVVNLSATVDVTGVLCVDGKRGLAPFIQGDLEGEICQCFGNDVRVWRGRKGLSVARLRGDVRCDGGENLVREEVVKAAVGGEDEAVARVDGQVDLVAHGWGVDTVGAYARADLEGAVEVMLLLLGGIDNGAVADDDKAAVAQVDAQQAGAWWGGSRASTRGR